MSYQPPDPLKPPTEEDVTAWASSYLQSGVDGLRGDAQYAWALVRVLTRQALELCLEGKGPGGLLGESAPHVEAELLHKTPGVLHGDSPAEDAQDTQHLQELLTRYDELADRADWLRRGPGGYRFSDPTFAVLLVGFAVSNGHKRAAELRVQVLRDRSWAQAAWVAALRGDDLGHYLTLLEQETEPLWLLEGLFVFAHALGGAPDGLQPTEALRRFFLMSMATLVWLAPVWKDYQLTHAVPPKEEDSPLFFSLWDWRRAIYCLARGSRLFGRELPALEHAWQVPPEPLRRVLAVLALPPRLSEEEARAVCVLCAPVAAAWQGWMGRSFWRTMHTHPSPSDQDRWWLYWVNTPLPPNWLRSALATLVQAQPDYAMSTMVCPDEEGSLARYLVFDSELGFLWIDLWRCLLASPAASQAATAWARVLADAPSAELLQKFLLQEAPAALRAQGLWEQALQALDGLMNRWLSWAFPSDRAAAQVFLQQSVRLLQLPSSRLEEWLGRSSPPTFNSANALQLLISIGVRPVAVMHRWLRALREAPGTWYSDPRQPQASLMTILDLGDPQVFTAMLDELAALTPEQAVKSDFARALNAFPPGPWLEHLLAWLRAERPEHGHQLLTRLAQRSQHFEVRRRCLQELLS